MFFSRFRFYPVFILEIIMMVFVAVGCGDRNQGSAPAPSPAPAQHARESGNEPGEPVVGVRSDAAPVAPAEPGAEQVTLSDEEISALLEQVTVRNSCNTVMGCPAGEALAAGGAAVVSPVIRKYESMKGSRYQRLHLLEILGRTGSAAAVPFLLTLLDDAHWNVRSNAAMALARLPEQGQSAELIARFQRGQGGERSAERFALAFAAARFGLAEGESTLLDGLSGEAVAAGNSGYTSIAVIASEELGLVRACPLLPGVLGQEDVFLLRAGVSAVKKLQCREGIPALEKLRSSTYPSVRAGAEEALKGLGSQGR